MIDKILKLKLTYFLLCYLVVCAVNFPLLLFFWGQGDDQPLLLCLFWPFYLGVMISDLLSPHQTKHNGFVVMVHSEVFYSILMLGFAFAMGLLVRRGLLADRRRRGMWLVLRRPFPACQPDIFFAVAMMGDDSA